MLRAVVLATLLLTGVSCLWYGSPTLRNIVTREPAALAAPNVAAEKSEYVTKNIEDIRVGDVIPAMNPEGAEVDALNLERPDPETWRLLELIAPKRDGTVSEITLLRPLWWLEEQQAEVGGEVWVQVPECGISSWAKLLSVGPCPEIESKSGEVVTGTFKHTVRKIIDVWIEGGPEPLGTTPNHPFWNEDKQEFVRADELEIGTRLLTALASC